jgi:prepilin-type N-terminal cleavage/methylation domain-containing protein
MHNCHRVDYPDRKRAFTLIELLVVISIISLLIAVLLPALASARKSGHAISCASSLRQIGIAGFAYTNDFDGYFPRVSNTIGASLGPHPTIKFFDWWVAHLMCYTGHATYSKADKSWQKATDIWDCPSNPSPYCSNGASGNYVINREIAYNFRADVTNLPQLDRNLGRPTLWGNASGLIYLGMPQKYRVTRQIITIRKQATTGATTSVHGIWIEPISFISTAMPHAKKFLTAPTNCP